MTAPATRFGAVAAILLAAHHVGDYWLQTHGQAQAKGKPGAEGRRACAAHVATYTLGQAAALAAADRYLGLGIRRRRAVTGLAVSAATHYLVDRRRPLEAIANRLGKGKFYRVGAGHGCLGTGAGAMDQSWHLAWCTLAAAVVAGPGRR
ncbi:hypothetical protein B4N89_27670 [Embleya scabrispora]|uniref:DUF3307 domain-containing protein n=1 Tax=Embleya scabrispora TaxID=159449 RepID=A0A1T3P572_9ACTN|nr:DUF3307 domain-containing protein [Embleya scabrispora]OPC84204.1 hypothetical protein B4N89_27670 [Embleya scabrispora]